MPVCQRITVRRRMLAALGACVLCAPACALARDGVPYVGDLGQALAALAVFLVLLAVLGKWAWRPIVTELRRREEAVSREIDMASQKHEQADELLIRYRRRMDSAEQEAQELIAESRDKAAATSEEAVAAAREEAAALSRQAREQLDEARRETLGKLQGQAVELASDMARQVLAGSLSEADHRRLVDESVEKIRKHVEGS